MGSIRLDGDVRKLMKRLGKLSNIELKSSSIVLAEILRESTRQRFKEQKSPEGKAWTPSIRATDEAGSTLTDTARLKNSIKSKASGTGFAVGTNLIYAKTHQFGEKGRTIRAKTSRGLRFKVNSQWMNKKQVTIKIPARPYLGISEEDMLEIKRTMEDMLED